MRVPRSPESPADGFPPTFAEAAPAPKEPLDDASPTTPPVGVVSSSTRALGAGAHDVPDIEVPTEAPTSDEVALAQIVARLRRAMRRAARASDPRNGLSVAQLELLTCLAENPGARPSELARLLRLAPNSVTTLVNGLHRLDLVARGDGGPDRRTVSLTLTVAGEHAVRNWQATNAAILASAFGELHPAWRHLLTAALPALRELVEAIDELDG